VDGRNGEDIGDRFLFAASGVDDRFDLFTGVFDLDLDLLPPILTEVEREIWLKTSSSLLSALSISFLVVDGDID